MYMPVKLNILRFWRKVVFEFCPISAQCSRTFLEESVK